MGGYISITHLKEAYDRLIHRCNELEEPSDDEEAEELDMCRSMCIKALLLLLVGLEIFANKNSKGVNLIWLATMQDLDTRN